MQIQAEIPDCSPAAVIRCALFRFRATISKVVCMVFQYTSKYTLYPSGQLSTKQCVYFFVFLLSFFIFFCCYCCCCCFLCVCLFFLYPSLLEGRGNRWVGGWVCQFVDCIQMLDRIVVHGNFYSLQCYSSKHRTVSSKSSGGITLQEHTTCLDIFSD